MQKTKKPAEHSEKTYSEAIQNIIEALAVSQNKRLDFARNNDGACRPMNVDLVNGIADPITGVFLDKDDRLFAEGESGQVYPLGTDIDGQDTFEIAGLDILMRLVED